jgi:hypothetical protein
VLENIKAKGAAEREFAAKYPQLMKLYAEFIETRFQAMAGARNGFIVQAVPFLYRAVTANIVLELVKHFHDCNRSLFKATTHQHMKETTAMLGSVMQTYLQELQPTEREIYEALPNERERDTFRICRDLARRPASADREPFTFFLSFDHLACRLGLHGTQAQRILRQFESYRLLKLLEKGTRRAAGVRGKAGTYRWLLV